MRAGCDARYRLRQLSLRHLVVSHRRRRLPGSRHRAEPGRRGDWSLQGVQLPCRKWAVPDRALRRNRTRAPRARSRIRHHHGTRTSRRLVRCGRGAARCAAERRNRNRAHPARCARRIRSDSGRRWVRARRRGNRQTYRRSRPTTIGFGRCLASAKGGWKTSPRFGPRTSYRRSDCVHRTHRRADRRSGFDGRSRTRPGPTRPGRTAGRCRRHARRNPHMSDNESGHHPRFGRHSKDPAASVSVPARRSGHRARSRANGRSASRT